MTDFPDLPHLRQLQKDLWQWPRARAALMVGAGFSLNAEPLAGVTSRFPTWRQLVRAMFDELHPRSADETPEDTRKREEQFSGTNPLRIASEYEAAFGRRKLDLLILRQNPDSDFKPSKLHTLLLQLPWVDVFTTNYDTLLERTEVPGRAYQPIIKPSELTTAFAPRIIKLHGSFPSQTPFIISEEDYRAYPARFAPFVNSVQQSLLENTFVLLGFSGDDPNFLAWTGWIRDELGNDHAPIYLVGPLGLKPPERSLLALRGVTPIDLAPLFARLKPPQGVHAAALEWFIASLAAGRIPRPEKWPSLPAFAQETPMGCPAVLANETLAPAKLDLAPQKPLDLATVGKVVERWQFDRKRYPGWLILDESKRSEFWISTKHWIGPLLAFADQWPATDRLVLFREINWRLEVSLVPLFAEWIQHFQKAVDAAFVELSKGGRLECSVLAISQRPSASECVDAWFSLALGLVREARETYAGERWEALKQQIDKITHLHPTSSDRVTYESALWAMWNVEHDSAKAILASWQPSTRSPLAGMWKAGLLAELDELGEARTILRSGLSEIRKALRTQGNNIELLSLEGWCTYLLASVESAQEPGRFDLIRQEFWERWQELKAFDCSPWPHKEFFDQALAKPLPQPHKEEIEVRGFDPGQVSISRRWRDDLIQEYLPAFACIRLHEQAGIPVRLRHFDLVGKALSNACRWIAPFISFWSPALLIRAGKTKEFKEGDFLSRTSVAEMEAPLAKRLYEWCFNIFERQLAKAAGAIAMESAHEAVLETLPEVLSRLSVRVDEEHLRNTFPMVLLFHRQPAVRAHIRMHDAAEPWFRRLFDAASGKLLLEWLPQLIRAPLFDEGTPAVIPASSAWPDPMRHFPSDRAREKTAEHPELVEKIRESTDWLLRRAASESGEGRQRALFRLTDVFHAKLMTPGQEAELGRLLWAERTEKGLPKLRNLAVFSFLYLPAPPDVDVKSLVKAHILALSSQGVVVRDTNGNVSIRGGLWHKQSLIYEATLASKPIVQLRGEALGGVEWTDDEAQQLYERAREWWLNDRQAFEIAKRGAPFGLMGADPVLSTLEEFGHFFSRVILPHINWTDDSKWAELLEWMEEVRVTGVFPTLALPYVVLHRPIHAEEFSAKIQYDLNSEDPKAVASAANAVRHWIHLAALGKTPAPPSTLTTDLLHRIVFRCQPAILSCLGELTFLIVDLPTSVCESDTRLLEKSLIPWESATRLDCVEEVVEFPVAERPELRVFLARLAGALRMWFEKMAPGVPEPDGIRIWREASASSALPEVRRAFDTFRISP